MDLDNFVFSLSAGVYAGLILIVYNSVLQKTLESPSVKGVIYSGLALVIPFLIVIFFADWFIKMYNRRKC